MEDFRMARFAHAMRLDPENLSSTVQALGPALVRQAETAGERLASFASALRDAMPTNGAAALLGEGRTALGRRFTEGDVRQLGEAVRRHPLPSMLAGAGLAFVAYRMAARRRAAGTRATSGRPVRDVMTSHVEVIRPDTSLKDAAGKMADLDVGTMPVCDGERLVGMLTDRDITVRGVARGLDPSSTPVREIMTTTVRWVYDDEPVDKAVATMKRGNIRRLPVIDRNKRLTGILALGDLAKEDVGKAGNVLEDVSEAWPTT
jgi:CBS domain-containing protein